ncbi:MAG: hypothetical protein LBH13_01735 [Cellulomonadaceae bacterium]|jgi:hypothetical protein|nr:hypothetical protein [Cellulomonadaceae bacterium]
MVVEDPRNCLDVALVTLATRLDPIIAARLDGDLGGLPWTAVLTQLDVVKGKKPGTYSVSDPQAQLRILTERLGGLGFPFDDYKRTVSTLGSRLRIARNQVYHHDEVTLLDVFRMYDDSCQLLGHLGDAEGAAGFADLRDRALVDLAAERGVAHVAREEVTLSEELAPSTAVTPNPPAASTEVQPEATVMVRDNAASTGVVGGQREEYEPWPVAVIGEKAELDDLRKKYVKQKVHALAEEIVEFEGPIPVNRVAALITRSFGMERMDENRRKQIGRQVGNAEGVTIVEGYAWPPSIDPNTWSEFRPNNSGADRPFTDISPLEIANAMRFIGEHQPGITPGDLETKTLRTFGRARRGSLISAHLAKAAAMVS